MEIAQHLLLVIGVLVLASILAAAFTPRLGAPLLLVFLVIGMLAGSEGPGGLTFNSYPLANIAGIAALAVILFDGGLRTEMEDFRTGLGPALSLATIGVLVTAGITGAAAVWLLHLPGRRGCWSVPSSAPPTPPRSSRCWAPAPRRSTSASPRCWKSSPAATTRWR
jgi:potassium/proton antiporter, CPA1 family (TC 2.A.36)